MRAIVLGLFIVACGGGGAPEEIQRICTAMTECGAIPSTDTERCITELDAVTPDSATRAASECADCLDTMTCRAIDEGDCAPACKPLFDTINGTPGRVTGACTSMTTDTFATRSNMGNLLISLGCPSADDIEIVPGPYFDTVGTSRPCGRFDFASFSRTDCANATGTVTIVERDSRRWVDGTCTCSGVSVTFQAPLRIRF